MSTRPYCRVFYAGLIYDEYPDGVAFYNARSELPDGVFVYFPGKKPSESWYLKDLTPVLHNSEFSDVPKALLLSNLLLDS